MKRIAAMLLAVLASSPCLAQDPWTGPKSAALSQLASQQCNAPELSSAMMTWAKVNGFREGDRDHRIFVEDFVSRAGVAFRVNRSRACQTIATHAADVLRKFN